MEESVEALDGTVVVGDVLAHGGRIRVAIGNLDGFGIDIGDAAVAVDSGLGIPHAVDFGDVAEGEMGRADVIPEEEGIFARALDDISDDVLGIFGPGRSRVAFVEGEFSDGLDVGFRSNSGEDLVCAEELDEGGEVFVNAAEFEVGRILFRKGKLNAVVVDVSRGRIGMGKGSGKEGHFRGRTNRRERKGAGEVGAAFCKGIEARRGESIGAEAAEVGGLVFGDEDEDVEGFGNETQARECQSEKNGVH